MTKKKINIPDLSNIQWTGLIILRILIGWHLLYEGMVKITDPNWTSAYYLENSTWIFSGAFKAIAENSSLLYFVDLLNQWGLLMIGFALIAGLFSRAAALSGMAILLLYYIAQPPLFESAAVATEGHYLIVNKLLIEAAGLFVLIFFPTGKIIGIDRLFYLKKLKEDNV